MTNLVITGVELGNACRTRVGNPDAQTSMNCFGGMTLRVAVVVVVLLGLAGASEAWVMVCRPSGVVVVGEERENTICSEEITEKDEVYAALYMQPGDDFMGVSFEVTRGRQNATSYVAWLNLYPCYSKDDTWIPLTVSVGEPIWERGTVFSIYNETHAALCKMSPVLDHNTRISIVVHGSSRWTATEQPTGGGCYGMKPRNYDPNRHIPPCTGQPIRTITTNNNTNTTATTTTTATCIVFVTLGKYRYYKPPLHKQSMHDQPRPPRYKERSP